MAEKRLLVGLTGVFGSGKSTTGKLFKKLGACLIDCDALVQEVYKPSNPIFKKVAKKFRVKNKVELAKIVFSDKKKRRELEALIHPYVFDRVTQIIKKSKSRIVLIDMPPLFEVGFEKQVDLVLVVSANSDEIEKRLAGRGFPKEEVKRRLRAQMPLREKIKRADLVIYNSGSKKSLEGQIKKIWNSFKK